MSISTLQGKVIIKATLKLKTGTHIGASNDFAPIGAVDNVVVRDPLTKRPIIPGSSLKGKLRTLLARVHTDGYIMQDINNDSDEIKLLFGSSAKNNIITSRLQFYDLFMKEESVSYIEKMNTDLYLSEIKFENTISRATAIANPRQIERVPAGAEFDFKLVYNVEDKDALTIDMKNLAQGLHLLSEDYIGGHGTRGYGRIVITDFTVEIMHVHNNNKMTIDETELVKILERK